MHLSRSLLLTICLTVVPVFLSKAQDRMPSGESRAAELVEQLKDVIQRAERNRTSDPRLIQQLRDLVRRYDWPWRDRKSTRLNSSHIQKSRMPSSA